MEAQLLRAELAASQSQLEETKRSNELLQKTLTFSKKSQENCGDNAGNFLRANRNLSAALEKAEERAAGFEKKIEKLVVFKKIVESCAGLECKVSELSFAFSQIFKKKELQ